MKNNEIRQPLTYLYIGLCGLIFLNIILPILCVLGIDTSMTWYESLIFCLITTIPFNILFVCLILLSINWKVVVYDAYSEFFNIFKKKKIFQFSDYLIKKYPYSTKIVKKIKTKKNMRKTKNFLTISSFCLNYEILFQKYNEYTTNKRI